MKFRVFLTVAVVLSGWPLGFRADERGKPVGFSSFVDRAPSSPTRQPWLEFDADGQTVRLMPTTRIDFKRPLRRLEDLTAGTAVVVRGRRDPVTRRVVADRVRFSINELEPGEARLWKSLATDVNVAHGLAPGELRIHTIGTYRLLRQPDVQAYVADVGARLIPPHQAALPPGDPRKIPFQFHVVVDDSVNAFATPNGIVVIHTGLLKLLENEAQLAAILAHEIVHATHEHTWRERQHHKVKRIAIGVAGIAAAAFGVRSGLDLALMLNAAIISRHARALENQSDRVGLYYMAQAGYDPREAPAVWELLTARLGPENTDLFWSSHESQTNRRAYLEEELAVNYSDRDLRAAAVNAPQFRHIRALVRMHRQ